MNCLLLFFFEVRLHHLNFVFILKEGKIRHITLIYAAYYSSHFHIYFHLFIFGFSSIPYQNIETWGKSSKNKICWVAYLFSFTCKQKLYMHKLIRFFAGLPLLNVWKVPFDGSVYITCCISSNVDI